MRCNKNPLTDLGIFGVTLAVLFLLFFVCCLLSGPTHSAAQDGFTQCTESLPLELGLESAMGVDPLPTSDSLAYYKLIDRMTTGILNWKYPVLTKSSKSYQFWFCGEVYAEGSESHSLAKLIATHIVTASQVAGVNPWGVLGTMAKESSFDICAFGLHPRKKAYELGVLKPSKKTISHTFKDVVRALQNKSLAKHFRSYDLGGLQVLDKYYRGDRLNLLTWEGFYWQVHHMGDRAGWYKTDRPWAYWPGSHSSRYDAHVTYLARKMGARKDEI